MTVEEMVEMLRWMAAACQYEGKWDEGKDDDALEEIIKKIREGEGSAS